MRSQAFAAEARRQSLGVARGPHAESNLWRTPHDSIAFEEPIENRHVENSPRQKRPRNRKGFDGRKTSLCTTSTSRWGSTIRRICAKKVKKEMREKAHAEFERPIE